MGRSRPGSTTYAGDAPGRMGHTRLPVVYVDARAAHMRIVMPGLRRSALSVALSDPERSARHGVRRIADLENVVVAELDRLHD